MSDKGVREILPKDEGLGVMISAFQTREFGFGMELTTKHLQKINEKRKQEQYIDEVAAVLKRGTAEKQPLTTSLFYTEFEYGANKDGYWTYEHFVLQCEDVADCLQVLYPEIEFRFLVDHSCGHDQQRDDGLNAGKMDIYFGGKQPKMHSPMITEEDSFLGPFTRKLKVGDKQSFTFGPEDSGSFWMSGTEIENRRNNRYTSKKKIKIFSTRELQVEIHSKMPSLLMKDL